MHLTYNGMRIVVCTVQGRLQLTYTVLRTEHKVTTPTLADQGRLQLTYSTVLRTEHKVTTPTLADQSIGSNYCNL